MGAWVETTLPENFNRCRVSRLPWARGLKRYCNFKQRKRYESRLPWARGLKLFPRATPISSERVAPPVGAWVETGCIPLSLWFVAVAPPVGAWVETMNCPSALYSCKVAPPVGAWVETATNFPVSDEVLVAPPVGAWVETS